MECDFGGAIGLVFIGELLGPIRIGELRQVEEQVEEPLLNIGELEEWNLDDVSYLGFWGAKLNIQSKLKEL